MEYNEKNLPLAKWLIDKTNTKDYRIGNLLGMKHPKVDGDLLKIVVAEMNWSDRQKFWNGSQHWVEKSICILTGEK